MRTLKFLGAGALSAGLAFSGCADTTTTDSGPTIGVNVAPLELPGMQDACYGITVTNGGGDTVWSETNICGHQYGFETEISYVGTCDASEGNAEHTIALVIEQICATDDCLDDGNLTNAVAESEWDNPCADGNACELTATCEENADVPVNFNFTVMRDANQGFFDVAVNFDDIFCSAKVDCNYDNGDEIQLLHNAEGDRDNTVVLALTCTAGDDASTNLYMNDVVISCDGVDVATIDPSSGEGNLGVSGGPVFDAAVYVGNQSQGTTNLLYWNVAVGFDDNDANLTVGEGCSISTRATASDGAFGQPAGFAGATPDNTTYPVIDFDVNLGSAGALCGQHPLNGDDSNVTTVYTPFAGESFDNGRDSNGFVAVGAGQDSE